MTSHLQNFARDLIKREKGPVSTATIVHVFTNLGNKIEGVDAEAQRAKARELLGADEGLVLNKDGDTWNAK